MTDAEKEKIKGIIDKIGLNHCTIEQDGNNEYILAPFMTSGSLKGDWKKNLISGLNDLIRLCEDYIQKIKDEA